MNLDSTVTVIDTKWYGNEHTTQGPIVSGAVLIYNLHHFRCYIWVWTNEDEEL